MSRPLGGPFRDDIRVARTAQGFTVRDVEAEAGVSHGYTAMIESGRRLPPKPENILALARYLHLDPYRLFLKAAAEHTAATLKGWFSILGVDPRGCRLILKSADGEVVFDIDLVELDGAYDPPDPGRRERLLAHIEATYGRERPGNGSGG